MLVEGLGRFIRGFERIPSDRRSGEGGLQQSEPVNSLVPVLLGGARKGSAEPKPPGTVSEPGVTLLVQQRARSVRFSA